MNIIWPAAIISALYFGGKELLKAKNTKEAGENLVVDINRFSLKPLSVNLDFINQVNRSVQITKPVIQLYAGDLMLAYSEPDVNTYVLPPLGKISKRIAIKPAGSGLNIISKVFNMNNLEDLRADYSLYINGYFVNQQKPISL